MTEPRDDELAAMLVARADRMPVSAARDVMAAVRGEMRAPKGAAGFAVLPVLVGSRRSKAPTGWAAIGLVAVLVLAVMGGRLTIGPATPTAGAASGGTPASSAAAAATTPTDPTSPTAVPLPVIPTMTMDELRAGLADGSLDGQIVLVTGVLELQPLPCPSPMPEDCYGLQLQGLDGAGVALAGAMIAHEAIATIQRDTADRPMAFRVTGGQLELLGWVTHGADTQLTVTELLREGVAAGPNEIAVVGGWLLGGRSSLASCQGLAASPCADTRPVLADASPRPDGQPGTGDATEVMVDDSLGLAAAPASLAGPFLVRHMAPPGVAPAWGVVASLDPATTVRVVPPAPRR